MSGVAVTQEYGYLSIRDFHDVLMAVLDARRRWYYIGLVLRISPGALDAIQMSEQGNPHGCLRAMIKVWLRSDYPQPTWAALEKALRSPMVGFEDLADQLSRRHYTESWIHTDSQNDLLYISDLAVVLEAVWEARMKWFNIGIQLGTSVSALDVIHVSEQGDPDNCITAMIKNWLRSVDIQPTWAALARALRSPTVGCGHLAEQLDTQKADRVGKALEMESPMDIAKCEHPQIPKHPTKVKTVLDTESEIKYIEMGSSTDAPLSKRLRISNVGGSDYLMHGSRLHGTVSKSPTERYFSSSCHFQADYSGKTYTIKEHGITITIPEGSIKRGETVDFQAAVVLCGPFNFSQSRQPISPILLLCPLSHPNLVFNKPMEVTIPHYLTYLEEGDYEKYDVRFSKAGHTFESITFQPLTKESAKVEMQFVKKENQCYGILRSTHCCCLCITKFGEDQEQLQEQTSKAGYCLSRVETPFQDDPRSVQITFYISFMLPTCYEVLKSQFPKCNLSVSHYNFRFAMDSDPSLQIVINRESNGYRVVGVDPENLKIHSSRVEFWDKRHQLQLLQETQQYPPRVKVTVSLNADCSTTPVTFPIRFHGCTEGSNLDVDIPLLLPRESRLQPGQRVSQAQKSTRLTDKHFSGLVEQLMPHASKWREMGVHLAFRPGELSNIEARPNLNRSAPESHLGAMLEEWIQWAPGDSRGSTGFATLDRLKSAVCKAGLGAAAHDLNIIVPMASDHSSNTLDSES